MIAIPSVTQAIGFGNPGAFANIPPDLLQAAQDRGTKFHEVAAAYALKLWLPELRDDLTGFFLSFSRWFDKFVVETVMVEQRLSHPTLYYEGTPDWVGRLKGDQGLTLLDWKTPHYASKGWRLQLAGYKALAEQAGHKITRVASLQPRRDGKVAKFIDYPNSLTGDLGVFMAVLSVWRFYNGD
ncbi:PD-(D/E)XK nuclease superfamily protein [Desulfarculales bacterium]